MHPRPAALGASLLLALACSGPELAREPAGAAAARAPALARAQRCNVCGFVGVFDPIGDRTGAACPKCKARERHRLFMLYLERETDLPRASLDVLHFSPMPGEKQRLRQLSNLRYKTADVEREAEDLWADITAMIFVEDATWDVIIAYHVLEHVADDRAAIREMMRVLRPGGRVFLQVPLDPARAEIDEDPAIVDPRGRAQRFGQWDHVRAYSAEGLRARLEDVGFVVEVVDYLARLDPALVDEHGLASRGGRPLDESIWIAHKPR